MNSFTFTSASAARIRIGQGVTVTSASSIDALNEGEPTTSSCSLRLPAETYFATLLVSVTVVVVSVVVSEGAAICSKALVV